MIGVVLWSNTSSASMAGVLVFRVGFEKLWEESSEFAEMAYLTVRCLCWGIRKAGLDKMHTMPTSSMCSLAI